jgi:hypothetical protein
MQSGWLRWILEQFEFPFEVVYPPSLDAGNLVSQYDVLIFVRGAIPRIRSDSTSRFRSFPAPNLKSIPQEYHNRVGSVTAAKTIPHLIQFVKDGGTVLAIGSSTSFGYYVGLPISNFLVEKLPDGTEQSLPRAKYFVPGSILQVCVDNTNPLAYGMPEKVDVSFNNSPVFQLQPVATKKGIQPVAWFDSKNPLRSGWAWGKHYLDKGIVIIESGIGKGKLFLYGPEIIRRAQPHGTFKFLFNGIYYGGSTTIKLK